ncbi:hypothetical protein D3C81_1009880 [compost metagenome]
MRRDDDLWVRQHGLRWLRFAVHHVEGGAAQLAGIQAAQQGGVVDQAATADIDQQWAFHAAVDEGVIDQIAGRFQ